LAIQSAVHADHGRPGAGWQLGAQRQEPEVALAPALASNFADVEAYGVGRPCRRCRSVPEPEKGVRMRSVSS
jgi:hypothetical protein